MLIQELLTNQAGVKHTDFDGETVDQFLDAEKTAEELAGDEDLIEPTSMGPMKELLQKA